MLSSSLETFRDNKRGSELLFDKFKRFCPVFAELKIELDAHT